VIVTHSLGQPATLLTGLTVGESVRWHDGRVWVANWNESQIVSCAEDGSDRDAVEAPAGVPISFDWLPDGSMLIVDGPRRRLLRLAGDGTAVAHAELSGLSEYAWNEIVIDGRGNTYVNSICFDFMAGEPPAPGIIALLTPEGQLRKVADGLEFPNGMVVTPDNSTLIVAESFAARLTAFQITDDGRLGDRRVWAEHPADGITLDAEGAIWCGSFGNGTPYCARVAEGGEILERVELDLAPFSCALGGAHGRTLFLAAVEWNGMERMGEMFASRTGQLLAVPAPAAGAGWP
jgi:sugar lactone lactonase YvrE